MINLDFLQSRDFGKYKPEQIRTDYKILFHVLIALGKKFDPNFEIESEDDKELYQNLLLYFTDNKSCRWDLSKGLLLTGKKGLGKSMSLKLIRELFLCGHNIPPLQRKKFFKVANMESLSVKTGKNLLNLERFYLDTASNLFCDEVMRETKDSSKNINNFGTIEQPFSVGLHQMYRSFCDSGKLFHFTTNYWSLNEYPDGKLFAETYGSEIQDRILEMCNIIELSGKSKRK